MPLRWYSVYLAFRDDWAQVPDGWAQIIDDWAQARSGPPLATPLNLCPIYAQWNPGTKYLRVLILAMLPSTKMKLSDLRGNLTCALRFSEFCVIF